MGTFQNQTTYRIGTSPYSIVAADFNNDMKLDLLVTYLGSNDVSVFLNECK